MICYQKQFLFSEKYPRRVLFESYKGIDHETTKYPLLTSFFSQNLSCNNKTLGLNA